MKPMVSGIKVPEARPLIIWNAKTKRRSGENGSSEFEIANMKPEIVSTRRGPKTAPSQTATGPTSI
jgi:hypothetical protein